jgi:hypothetical protein
MSLPFWFRRLFASKEWNGMEWEWAGSVPAHSHNTMPAASAPAHRRPAQWSGLGAYLLAWAAVLLICAGMVALTVVLVVPRAVILALQAAARQRHPKKSLASSTALDVCFISPAPLQAPSRV